MKRIFVNGTFDILHPGHVQLLTYAKSLGDRLLVALDSDDRIKKLKGNTRPINSLAHRTEMMLALKPVDQVIDFSSDVELVHVIQQYDPHIIVVGSDYRNKVVIGSEYAEKLVFFDRINGYSSTQIIESISSR